MGIIIGFSGKIGSGKTTLAKWLVEETFDIDNLVHFADALKQASSAILGIPVAYFSDQDHKNDPVTFGNKKLTIGSWLQYFGTDLMRTEWKDVWVNALMNTLCDDCNYVIDDVRFKNEADAIKKAGGYLIRLEGDPKGIRANSTRNLMHSSETELDDYGQFDYVISTDQPIDLTIRTLILFLHDKSIS